MRILTAIPVYNEERYLDDVLARGRIQPQSGKLLAHVRLLENEVDLLVQALHPIGRAQAHPVLGRQAKNRKAFSQTLLSPRCQFGVLFTPALQRQVQQAVRLVDVRCVEDRTNRARHGCA